MTPWNESHPILCAHLLWRVDELLLALLADLRRDEWDLPTTAPDWRVRDVAAHLLDTPLRKLSMVRDAWVVEPAVIRSPADLASLVNRLNREGVAVYRRLSPAVLISLMRDACLQSATFHEALDPYAPAAFPVSWAGEDRSPNWFDTARELTERWHHQQQIREATGRPGLMIRELYHPVLDCFLRGLPHGFRQVQAAAGTRVRVDIAGDCGGAWQVEREASGWKLMGPGDEWDTRITIPQEIAWRVFTRGIRSEEAEGQVRIEGDRALALPVLTLTAIVA